METQDQLRINCILYCFWISHKLRIFCVQPWKLPLLLIQQLKFEPEVWIKNLSNKFQIGTKNIIKKCMLLILLILYMFTDFIKKNRRLAAIHKQMFYYSDILLYTRSGCKVHTVLFHLNCFLILSSTKELYDKELYFLKSICKTAQILKVSWIEYMCLKKIKYDLIVKDRQFLLALTKL